MLYFEAIDLAIEAITERFDQPGYKIFRNVILILLLAVPLQLCLLQLWILMYVFVKCKCLFTL